MHATTPVPFLLDRNKLIDGLFSQVHSKLEQSLYDFLPGLIAPDCSRIIEDLPIHQYDGPIDLEVFEAWVSVIAFALADHAKIGYAIASYMKPLMQAAATTDRMCTSGIGFYESAEDHVGNLAVVAYDPDKMYGRLRQPGRSAKLTTRLTALCRTNTRHTRSKRLGRQKLMEKAAEVDILNSGVEYVTSPDEIASTRFRPDSDFAA